MLAQTLQALERDGFVHRDAKPVIPPRVDYSLTPMGHEVAEQVWTLTRWVEAKLDNVFEAREAYDGRARDGLQRRRHRGARVRRSVRRRPGMYFGVARDNPGSATEALRGVLGHALHPAARVGPAHTSQVTAEVVGDLAFMVADDRAFALDRDGPARLGYFGSLLGPDRWASAAAAAVSSRTVVEAWRDGVGFRQELCRHPRRSTGPRRYDPPLDAGTRASFELDPDYFGSGHAIARTWRVWTRTVPTALEPAGPGSGHARGREERRVVHLYR